MRDGKKMPQVVRNAEELEEEEEEEDEPEDDLPIQEDYLSEYQKMYLEMLKDGKIKTYDITVENEETIIKARTKNAMRDLVSKAMKD